jgi:hypothetical protein
MTERPRALGAFWQERRVFSRYEAFTDLIELAATRRCSVRLGRHLVWIDRGQLTTSSRVLSDRWQWSRRQVVGFLTRLAKEGELTLEAIGTSHDAAGSKVSLLYYETYVRAPGPNEEKATLTPAPGAGYMKSRATPSQAKGHKTGHPKRLSGQGVTPFTEPLNGPPNGPYEVTPSPQVEIISDLNPEGGPGGNSEASHKSTLPTSTLAAHGPGFVHFADVVVTAANDAQIANGRIDRERFRPLAAHHKATLDTLLEWWGTGVSPDFARRYVWTEGQRYAPTPTRPQIASLAYLRVGLLRAWREHAAPSAGAVPSVPDPPRSKGKPTPISASATLARFLPHDPTEPEK